MGNIVVEIVYDLQDTCLGFYRGVLKAHGKWRQDMGMDSEEEEKVEEDVEIPLVFASHLHEKEYNMEEKSK